MREQLAGQRSAYRIRVAVQRDDVFAATTAESDLDRERTQSNQLLAPSRRNGRD